nr:leucine-rich repeat protein [Treponema sp. Marseille-Q4523]
MYNNTDTSVTEIPLYGTELNDIVSIRDRAFQNCTSLTSFRHNFAKSITHFGKYAFTDASITYFDIEAVALISGNYTWYKTEDEAAWKASDVSKAEKVDKTNLDLGTPTTDFEVYKKNDKYYWFAVKNP